MLGAEVAQRFAQQADADEIVDQQVALVGPVVPASAAVAWLSVMVSSFMAAAG
jgi:hypothetical protein